MTGLPQHVAGVLPQRLEPDRHGPVHVTAPRVAPGAVGISERLKNRAGMRASVQLLNRSPCFLEPVDRIAQIPGVPGCPVAQ